MSCGARVRPLITPHTRERTRLAVLAQKSRSASHPRLRPLCLLSRSNTCLLALVSCGRDVVFPHIAWPLLRIGAPCKPQWPSTSAYGTRMTSKASRRCTPRPPLSPTGMQHTVLLRHLYSCTRRVRPRGQSIYCLLRFALLPSCPPTPAPTSSRLPSPSSLARPDQCRGGHRHRWHLEGRP